MTACSKDTRIVCSIWHEKQVYLFCGPSEIMQWPTSQSATKFFKRFYSIIYKTGNTGLKKFHLLADFRLHSVKVSSIENESFENTIVKLETDKEKKIQAHEYSIYPIQIEGVHLNALPCYGKTAEEWHKKGVQPAFPKFR